MDSIWADFHRQVPVLQHVEFLRDGTGCPDIVSGQHFHFDAGTAAVADGGRIRPGLVGRKSRRTRDHADLVPAPAASLR